MLPTVPGQIATVLVALAVTELSPSQIRVGKREQCAAARHRIDGARQKCRRQERDRSARDGPSSLYSTICEPLAVRAGVRSTPVPCRHHDPWVFRTSASDSRTTAPDMPPLKWRIMAQFQVIQPETTYTGSPIQPLPEGPAQDTPSRSARIVGN